MQEGEKSTSHGVQEVSYVIVMENLLLTDLVQLEHPTLVQTVTRSEQKMSEWGQSSFNSIYQSFKVLYIESILL